MKNHRLMLRAVSIALIAVWLTGSLPAQGSALIHTAPPAVSSLAPASAPSPLGTAFTYQGLLKDGSGNPITNTCNLQFNLYDAATSGNLVGNNPQTVTGVVVSNGYFTVSLDFGSGAFNGSARWLQVGVSCPAGGSYTPLTPLQQLTAAPYALYAVNSGSALNADQLDGLHAAAFQQHYQNVRVVAKSGGDYTTLTAALNSITDASSTNPYLIYVAPGVYNETVTMKAWVDIQGAGESLTKITAAGSSSASTGTVIGADNAELRFLTVENTGGGGSVAYAIAIYNTASLSITHVTALASNANSPIGVENYANAPTNNVNVTMTDVTASASAETPGTAIGVYNYTVATGPGLFTMTVTMTNVNANASDAHTSVGVYNRIQSGKMAVTMTGVDSTASFGVNGLYLYGVENVACSPSMTNVTITVTGKENSFDYGVYNNAASPVITNLNVSVSGVTSSSNYGVWNESSSVTIQNSIISANASTGTNDGIHNNATSGTYSVTIDASQITGNTSTIYQTAQYTTMIGASKLVGSGAQGSGTYKCVASYNSNYNALGLTTCQ